MKTVRECPEIDAKIKAFHEDMRETLERHGFVPGASNVLIVVAAANTELTQRETFCGYSGCDCAECRKQTVMTVSGMFLHGGSGPAERIH